MTEEKQSNLPEELEKEIIAKCSDLKLSEHFGTGSWRHVMKALYNFILLIPTGNVKTAKAFIAHKMHFSLAKMDLMLTATKTFYDHCDTEKNIINCKNGYSTLQKYHALKQLIQEHKKGVRPGEMKKFNAYTLSLKNNKTLLRVQLEKLAKKIMSRSEEAQKEHNAAMSKQHTAQKNQFARKKVTVDDVSLTTLGQVTAGNLLVYGRVKHLYETLQTMTKHSIGLHCIKTVLENLSIDSFKHLLQDGVKDNDFVDTLFSILKARHHKNREKLDWMEKSLDIKL